MVRAEPRVNERGAILIFAALAMAGVITMGIVYLDISTSQLASQSLAEHRIQARALADGATEAAHQQLIDDPTFTGQIGPTSLGNGFYEITVTAVGSDREVEVHAMANGVSSYWTTRLEIQTGASSTTLEQVRAGSYIHLQSSSTMTVPAGIVHAEPNDIDVGSTLVGDTTLVSVVPAFSFDRNMFLGRADTVYNENHTFPAGSNVNGTVYVGGFATIESPFTLNGTIYCRKMITFEGTDPVHLSSGDEAAVIISESHVTFDNGANVTVNGDIYTQGHLSIDSIPYFQMNGRMFVEKQVWAWGASEIVMGSPPERPVPAEVSGIEPLGGASEIRERWRRPGPPP